MKNKELGLSNELDDSTTLLCSCGIYFPMLSEMHLLTTSFARLVPCTDMHLRHMSVRTSLWHASTEERQREYTGLILIKQQDYRMNGHINQSLTSACG